MQSNITIKGRVRLVCKDKDGNEKWDTGWINNGITNAGFAELANLAGNVSTPASFTYLATGSGSTAFAVSQTALVTENSTNGLERAAATVTRQTTTVSNDTLQLVKTFTATGAGGTVEEVGVFNAASSGTMLGRATTGTYTLSATDTLVVTYKVVFAAAA